MAVNREGCNEGSIPVVRPLGDRRKNHRENENNALLVSIILRSALGLHAMWLVFLSMKHRAYGMGLPFDQQEQEVLATQDCEIKTSCGDAI